MTQTYSVTDIANFLIQLSIENEKPLVRLHLQYMLYFINAQFLLEDDAPLFKEPFEKWAFGPTVREIKDATTDYGVGPITKTIDTFVITDKNFELIKFDDSVIETDTKNRLEKSFAKLIVFKVFELVDITLSQELYTKDKEAIMKYDAPNYKTSEIRQYFIDNPKDQIWRKPLRCYLTRMLHHVRIAR